MGQRLYRGCFRSNLLNGQYLLRVAVSRDAAMVESSKYANKMLQNAM
jgi:hypothetical protein